MSSQLHCHRGILIIVVSLSLLVIVGAVMAGNDGGSALGFNGMHQVAIAETASVQHLGSGGLTLEAWVQPSLLSGTLSIIRNNNDYNLMILSSGAMRAEVFPGGDGTSRFSRTTSLSTVPVGQWSHVAATWVTPTLLVYLNGNLIGATTANLTYAGPEALRLGRDATFPADAFYGNMDEIRIWNTARTADQIQATMFQQLTGGEDNLVGYWRFNEGTGQTVADLAGDDNNGQLGSTAGADVNDPTWIASSTAPVGALNAVYQNDIAGMWIGAPNTVADGVATGLEIANVDFLNAEGDDIVFGHNDSAFHGGETTFMGGAGTPNATQRWARLWEIDLNDVAPTGGNVGLTFDISEAGGSGTFDSGSTYYLLRRATGSGDDFVEVASATGTAVVGDQVTFTVAVAQLGSEFTLGAPPSAPTAVSLTGLNAQTQSMLNVWWVLGAIGAAVSIGWWRARRR